MARRRKHWGWGYADEEPSVGDVRAAMPLVERQLGFAPQEPEEAIALEAAALPEPGALPEPPAGVPWDTTDHARATHAWGKSYLDIVRGFRGRFDHAPDAVARPRDEADVAAVLEWASEHDVVVVPYGGGTSVVGGVTPAIDGPAVSLDVGALDRVLEVEPVSRARGCRPACSGRTSSASSASTTSRCATSRSRSSSRRSAVGSQPAPAATSRPGRRTSTTWSSRCAR